MSRSTFRRRRFIGGAFIGAFRLAQSQRAPRTRAQPSFLARTNSGPCARAAFLTDGVCACTQQVVIIGGPTSELADAALGSYLLVASFEVEALEDSGEALIEGTINDLIDLDPSTGASDGISNATISAGRGYLRIAVDARRRLLHSDSERGVTGGVARHPRHGVARTPPGYHRHLLQTGCSSSSFALGDVTGNGAVSGADLVFYQYVLLAKSCVAAGTCEAGAERNLSAISSMTAFQRRQLDPQMYYLKGAAAADALCTNSAQGGSPCATLDGYNILLNAVAEKGYFLDVDSSSYPSVVAVPTSVDGALAVEVALRGLDGCAVTDASRAEVLVEIRTATNAGMSPITGALYSTSPLGKMFTAAVVGDAWSLVLSAGSPGWQADPTAALVLIVRAKTADGNYFATEKSMFYDTSSAPASGSFDPFVQIDLPFTAAPTVAPTATPTATPTSAPTTSPS
eukprot:515575-Prorocentrum_minimum.AAC.1